MKLRIAFVLVSMFASATVSAATFCVNPERVGSESKPGSAGANFFFSFQDSCRPLLAGTFFRTVKFEYRLSEVDNSNSTCAYRFESLDRSDRRNGTLTCKRNLTDEQVLQEIKASGLLNRSLKLRMINASLLSKKAAQVQSKDDGIVDLVPETSPAVTK